MRRFEMTDGIEESWGRYQDELEEHPELNAMIKVRFEHFLKAYSLLKKDSETAARLAANNNKAQQLSFVLEEEKLAKEK